MYVQVNVLLCKQNITSLSLFIGTIVTLCIFMLLFYFRTHCTKSRKLIFIVPTCALYPLSIHTDPLIIPSRNLHMGFCFGGVSPFSHPSVNPFVHVCKYQHITWHVTLHGKNPLHEGQYSSLNYFELFSVFSFFRSANVLRRRVVVSRRPSCIVNNFL